MQSILILKRKILFTFPNKLELFRSISDIRNLSIPCYGLAVHGNVACIDAIVPPNFSFQFTTSL